VVGDTDGNILLVIGPIVGRAGEDVAPPASPSPGAGVGLSLMVQQHPRLIVQYCRIYYVYGAASRSFRIVEARRDEKGLAD